MHKFKVGDTVKVIDSPELHHWYGWDRVLNTEFTIKKGDLTHGCFHPLNNKYCINVPWKNVKLVIKQWDE